jgi:hypothetical protein
MWHSLLDIVFSVHVKVPVGLSSLRLLTSKLRRYFRNRCQSDSHNSSNVKFPTITHKGSLTLEGGVVSSQLANLPKKHPTLSLGKSLGSGSSEWWLGWVWTHTPIQRGLPVTWLSLVAVAGIPHALQLFFVSLKTPKSMFQWRVSGEWK